MPTPEPESDIEDMVDSDDEPLFSQSIVDRMSTEMSTRNQNSAPVAAPPASQPMAVDESTHQPQSSSTPTTNQSNPTTETSTAV